MAPAAREHAEDALEVLRFRAFTSRLAPLCALFALVYGASALALGEGRLLAAAGFALGLGAACTAGGWLAARGRLTSGAWVVGGALLAVALLFGFVLPFTYPTLVLMPVTAVALVLPYLRGAPLRLFVSAAALSSLGAAGVGLTAQGGRQVPPLLQHALLLGTLAVAVGLTALLLWQFSSRQREVLAEARQADARKAEFLAILAHELRNPLASIGTAAEVLRRRPEEARAQGDLIHREAAHVGRLLEDLLDVSRISQGQLVLRREPLALADVLGRAAELSRGHLETHRHVLHLEPGPAGLGVEGDAVRLVQVVANLLHNAAKYTPPGGQVWLSARRQGALALLEVRDTGVGLTAEQRGHIFEPFVQGDPSLARAHGGLGLGLALVRRLVALHDGRVEAESPGLGRGSTFRVWLPALPTAVPSAPAPAPSSAPPSAPPLRAEGGAGAEKVEEAEKVEGAEEVEEPAPAAPARRARVLLVDDNVNAARSLAVLVRLWGHEVEVAHDGPQALERARAFAPTHVVLDIGLPQMDGFEVARRLRADPALGPLRLFALSGYDQQVHRARAKEAGFEAHFVKPVSPDVLERALAS
jgi:two-component system CheB/CheR fusion protein